MTVSATALEPGLWDLVGETPLVPFPLSAGRAGKLLVKAEWLNPGGAVKDRAARHILRDGLARGALPDRRLLDASSGNTAVAYAMLGAAAGLGVTVCVPENVSSERLRLIQMYGADVIATDPLEGSDGAIRKARQLAAEAPDRYWYADQYGNPANPLAHYETTGPEIWRDTDGTITHFVAGLGTSGTLMGTARFLKEQRSDIQIIAVQPAEPFHGLEGLKHLETAMVPGIYDSSLIDETVRVTTETAETWVQRLARDRGMFLGWSGGAALAAAHEVVVRTGLDPGRSAPPVVVVIAPDGGTRYLSEVERLFGRRVSCT